MICRNCLAEIAMHETYAYTLDGEGDIHYPKCPDVIISRGTLDIDDETAHYAYVLNRVKMLRIAGMLLLLVAVLLGAERANAQYLPDAPGHTPKSFWVAAGVLGASVVADGITTQQFQQVGCVEQNAWVYGQHPSNARFYALSGVIEGTSMLISRQLIRSHKRPIRYLGWGLMSWRTSVRYAAVAHNIGADCRPGSGHE